MKCNLMMRRRSNYLRLKKCMSKMMTSNRMKRMKNGSHRHRRSSMSPNRIFCSSFLN